MNTLMIQVPTAEKSGSVPFGLLYAASSAVRSGNNVKLVDLAKEDMAYTGIKEIIKNFSPDIIGMGGITSSYKHCKELAGSIKSDFPNMPIVAGGVVSSIPDLLLRKAGVDYVIQEEGEISFPNLIKALENKEDISGVKGISFLRKGVVCATDRQPGIADLDDIPMPEYGLLDMEKYIEPAAKWANWYFSYDTKEHKRMLDKLSGKRLFHIITARGCTHRCTFCYRHMRGLRQHSVKYVINMIKHIKNTYGTDIFQINDELTTANRKWVLELCNSLIRENLGIYLILISSRVDTVDEEVLSRLKEAGCLMINYGYESGSDAILKEIRKGVTRDKALEAGILTRKTGLKNIPEIIIGFPSETEETVSETIDFLKRLDTWPVSINTPIPFPKTPLWEHALASGLIKDEEEFILGYKGGMFVNFTKYPDFKVMRFVDRVRYDVKLNWLLSRRMYRQYFRCFLERQFVMYVKPLVPKRMLQLLKKLYRSLFKK